MVSNGVAYAQCVFWNSKEIFIIIVIEIMFFLIKVVVAFLVIKCVPLKVILWGAISAIIL